MVSNKLYVTFGHGHKHHVKGKTFDMSTIAVITCKDWKDGREKAFEYFDREFCTSYYNEEFKHERFLPWSPHLITIGEDDE